jgi:hypothetical protein
MVKKGPKTDKGKARKLLGGDGRRKTPGEESVIPIVRTRRFAEETMNATIKSTQQITSGSNKKKTTKKK